MIVFLFSTGQLDDDEARLHRFLFANYSPEIRPVKRKTEVVTVKLGITIHQIIDLVSVIFISKNIFIYAVKFTWKYFVLYVKGQGDLNFVI